MRNSRGAAVGDVAAAAWNVPDWRDGKAYEYVASLNSTEKKWEAVRRFPAYRTKWHQHKDARGGFGLVRMLDPRVRGDELPPNTKFVDETWQGRVIDSRWDATVEYLDLLFGNDVVLVCIDLMRPARPQLDAAAKVLKTLRAKAAEECVVGSRSSAQAATHAQGDGILHVKRSAQSTPSRAVTRARRRPMFLKHLRAADAKDQGATWEAIAETIWSLQPDADGASDARKRHEDFFRDIHRLAPGP